jgi:hypothetical protein
MSPTVIFHLHKLRLSQKYHSFLNKIIFRIYFWKPFHTKWKTFRKLANGLSFDQFWDENEVLDYYSRIEIQQKFYIGKTLRRQLQTPPKFWWDSKLVLSQTLHCPTHISVSAAFAQRMTFCSANTKKKKICIKSEKKNWRAHNNFWIIFFFICLLLLMICEDINSLRQFSWFNENLLYYL